MNINTQNIGKKNLQFFNSKDLITGQEIRWCPGCGDYSILKQTQSILPQLGIKKENIVFISGIGCSSRFPYYMNTYGMHSIHGRAPSFATGLKISRPELSVWVITGDGDALSIGTNHLLHTIRRNIDINILLFNNEIYGLTKGQFSPTSKYGQITKSSPMGTIDTPFNPVALTFGAGATFIARTIDSNPSHLRETLKRAHQHKGTSFVEIYQNCNIFNDKAFFNYSNKEIQANNTIFLEHGKPLIFGKNKDKGIILNGSKPEIVTLNDKNKTKLWIHDENNISKAALLVKLFHNDKMPRPFGVIYSEKKHTYEELFHNQIKQSILKEGRGNLDKLLEGDVNWEI